MTAFDQILLGFESGTGKPVYLSLHHLAIFGMTQLSGKTTTLEALISRSGLRAIAFKTKRGEAGFSNYNEVTPYYKPRADWQFVEGLVNVALGEKVKYEPGMRYAIMKVCRGRHELKEIQKYAQQLVQETKKDFMKSVYEKLVAYLEIVLPELAKWHFSEELTLKEGINVMDLSGMRLETQHLVIASTIEYAFSYLDHVVVIVPEAWETLPQGKMTPVKWVAQQFIRKGATIGNYLWLDSQDIGGIDKTPLRQCDNWLMGRMKEAHEVERILKQLLGLKVPQEEIQTLPLGHFYAAIGNEVKKVYVLPANISEDVGIQVALGKMKPEQVKEKLVERQSHGDDEEMWKEKYEKLEKQIPELEKEMQQLREDTKEILEENRTLSEQIKTLQKDAQFGQQFRSLLKDLIPATLNTSEGTQTTLNLNHTELKVNVTHSERVLEFDTDKQQGQILYCALNDLKDETKDGFTEAEMSQSLQEHGWNIPHASLAPQLSSNLVKSGLLIRIEGRPVRYRLPSQVKITVK